MDILYALQRLDVRVFAQLFRQGERRLIRPLARALSRSADGYLYVLIPALLTVSGAAEVPLLLLLLACSLAFERPLYWLLKNGFKRRRPHDYLPGFHSIIVASDQFSFPSGHSSAAFMLATGLTIIYQEPAVAMYIWATSIALSRIILGVHYPGDTLAGGLMGSVVAVVAAATLGIR